MHHESSLRAFLQADLIFEISKNYSPRKRVSASPLELASAIRASVALMLAGVIRSRSWSPRSLITGVCAAWAFLLARVFAGVGLLIRRNRRRRLIGSTCLMRLGDALLQQQHRECDCFRRQRREPPVVFGAEFPREYFVDKLDFQISLIDGCLYAHNQNPSSRDHFQAAEWLPCQFVGCLSWNSGKSVTFLPTDCR